MPLGLEQEFKNQHKDLSKILSQGNEDQFKNSQVTMPVIESWLNETLREAEYFGIPCTFQKSQKSGAKAVYDYAIDRLSLS